MLGFLEFSEEKKITVKTKNGGEIPATIKVTGKDYHIVKTDSGKQYKVDHQGNSLEEEALDEKLDKKQELRDALSRHSEKAIEANRRGDDKAVKVHQNYMNKIKDKMAKLAHNEETEPSYKRFDADAEQERRDREEAETKAEREKTELAKRSKMKEEVELDEEQLDEISTAAKQNYINAAALDVARHGNMLGRAQVGKSKTSASISGKKIDKRLQGIATATSKLTKEENDKDIPFDPPYSKVKADVPAKGTKGTHTAMSRARHLARIALQNVQKKKNVKEQDGKISIGEEADKDDSKHRVLVTLSDPNHTMASQRKEKIQKHVKLSAASKEDAIARAQAHYRKRGYKVHDAEHVGIVKEETQGEQ